MPGAANRFSVRELLLESAAVKIAEFGYLGMNLGAVVERLGLTKGALAYYFPQKERLACALVHSASQDLQIALREAHRDVDHVDVVQDGALAALRLFSSSPVAHAGLRLSLESEVVPVQLPELISPWCECVSTTLAVATNGRLQRGEARSMAQIMVSCVVGVAMTGRIQKQMAADRRLRAQVGAVWMAMRPSLLEVAQQREYPQPAALDVQGVRQPPATTKVR